jgi:hypothetical protein
MKCAVVIDPTMCSAGQVPDCAPGIPQRQSGIGLYLHILPTLGQRRTLQVLPVPRRIEKNELPVCSRLSPGVMTFAPGGRFRLPKKRPPKRGDSSTEERKRGTSTLYLSPVPFKKLNGDIEKKPGSPIRPGEASDAETNAGRKP